MQCVEDSHDGLVMRFDHRAKDKLKEFAQLNASGRIMMERASAPTRSVVAQRGGPEQSIQKETTEAEEAESPIKSGPLRPNAHRSRSFGREAHGAGAATMPIGLSGRDGGVHKNAKVEGCSVAAAAQRVILAVPGLKVVVRYLTTHVFSQP